jgi:hypothetical protein
MKIVSMRGTTVDMASLANANQHKVAVGNAGLNARGDKVNHRGDVVLTREQHLSEYNKSNPKAVRQVGLNGISNEVIKSPAEVVAQARKAAAEAKAGAVEREKTSRRKISESDV